MATKLKETEADFLGNARMAINNGDSHEEISEIVAEFGYTPEERAVGKTLLNNAIAVHTQNQVEHDEESQAFALFDSSLNELTENYSRDRKKAKVVFRRDPETLKELAVTERVPKAFKKQMEMFSSFYTKLGAKSDHIAKMGRLKFTADDLAARTTAIETVWNNRESYLQEKGEAQDSTIAKDEAIHALDEWLTEFLDVAEIALEERPQLMEILGIVVKR